MKRSVTLLLVAFILAGALFAIVWHAKFTVASEERHDEFSGVTYGYLIQQSYFWNSASLTIWLKRGLYHQMDASFYMPGVSIQKVTEQRWLANDAALFLNLTIKNHGSITSVDSLRMIFDFHKGQMYTSSKFTLWRIWNERNPYRTWTSEVEFNDVLLKYSDGTAK